MSYLPPVPDELQQVEYVKIYFHLRLIEYFDLPQWGLLQLRRELLQAVRLLADWGDPAEAEQLRQLLQPALPSDPLLRRQAKQPAPAFVISPAAELQGLFEPQQIIVLPVLFFGRGCQQIESFVSLLQQLGRQGLYNGTGTFELEAVESEDAAGVRMMHWSGGRQVPFSASVSDLFWLLERQQWDRGTLALDVVSPLRLLRKKKPLFKVSFDDLLPYLLRRVFALLACHAGVEVCEDQQFYLQQGQKVEVVCNSLKWHDWRKLQGDREQDLGGVLGRLQLSGAGLDELFWLLQLGCLFNIGKGAAYGAGQYRLQTHCQD